MTQKAGWMSAKLSKTEIRILHKSDMMNRELFHAIAYSNAEKQQAKSDAFSAKAVGITG